MDCFSFICQNGKCQGIPEGINCSLHSDCYVGYSCYNITRKSQGKCQKQKGENETCLVDYDCINTHGCNNGKCKEYFSAGPNEEVEYFPSTRNFCRSGITSTSGRCVNRVNLGKFPYICDSNNPCKYYDSYLNTTIIEPNSCLCGLNKFGNSYCLLGNGMKEYQDFISANRVYLKSTLVYNCHTMEREECPNAIKIDKLNYMILLNLKLKAKENHLIQGAEECVIKSVYPFYQYSNDLNPIY